MAKLNTGTKTEAAVRAAKAEELAEIEAQGGKIETVDGAKYLLSEVSGMTIRTRVD